MTRVRDRSRPHDIVLYGATGFTGRLVAEYLVRRGARTESADPPLRLALGGRSEAKLEALRTELTALDPRAASLPLIVADSGDRAALARMAEEASVVCTTVGPYLRYGEALLAACAAHGTDYCDLTGETPFIRRAIDAHQELARRTGARIVNCCGYDSIPSDLGSLMVQEAMKARYGVYADEVRCFAGESKGGASGGTIASMLVIAEEARRDRKVRRILMDPYAINPEGERSGPDGRDRMGVRHDDDLGMWIGPSIMAGINAPVVRRSHALLGYPWGRGFRYSEAMSFGKGPKGLARAAAVTAAIGGALAVGQLSPARRLAARWLPSPGEGPSRAKREAGYFRVRLIAKGRTQEGREVLVRGLVEGQQDPGYGETSKMLGEAATCLALEGAELTCEGGILTPASAMGMRLVERLRAAGMTFSVSH